MGKRDFLSITDFSSEEIWSLLHKSKRINKQLLADKSLVMIFEKPSLRTRLSFEIGMTQLGGHAIYLGPNDIGLGERESVSDAARVASSMGDLIMARVFKHKTVTGLAKASSVPVINGLSDLEHPCQILADLFTIFEHKGRLGGLKLAYIGDAENNIAYSLALASGLLGINFVAASPKGYWMKKSVVNRAKKLAKKSGSKILEVTDPKTAVNEADIVYTDTWISMGDEPEKDKRLKIFQGYQVTAQLMKLAKKDAIFMHDLPAYRGNEVAANVIDGEQSVVFQQAENRLHVQKSLMCFLIAP